jgi:quercetin dioxygenase-like cupin family protein
MTDRHPGAAGGHVIDNPISGERIVIHQSGADTRGRLLAFDLFLPPGGHVPAAHAHPVQEERFTVVAGQLRFRVGRRTILASPGETITVAPGTAHWFGNTAPTTTVAHVEIRPALRMEELLQRSGAIGAGRSWPGIAVPRLPDLALVLLEFERELAVPQLPAFLVRLCLLPLAWLARRRATARA